MTTNPVMCSGLPLEKCDKPADFTIRGTWCGIDVALEWSDGRKVGACRGHVWDALPTYIALNPHIVRVYAVSLRNAAVTVEGIGTSHNHPDGVVCQHGMPWPPPPLDDPDPTEADQESSSFVIPNSGAIAPFLKPEWAVIQ